MLLNRRFQIGQRLFIKQIVFDGVEIAIVAVGDTRW